MDVPRLHPILCRQFPECEQPSDKWALRNYRIFPNKIGPWKNIILFPYPFPCRFDSKTIVYSWIPKNNVTGRKNNGSIQGVKVQKWYCSRTRPVEKTITHQIRNQSLFTNSRVVNVSLIIASTKRMTLIPRIKPKREQIPISQFISNCSFETLA